MKMAAVEFTLDNGILVIGDDSAFPEAYNLSIETLPAVEDRLIAISCRQQIAPIRVELWRNWAPMSHCIISANLMLSGGMLALGECFGRPLFRWPASSPGSSLQLDVYADDEVEASLISVVVQPNKRAAQSSCRRSELLEQLDQVDDISRIDVILAERSFPVVRLSAAFRVIRRAMEGDASIHRIRYAIEATVEWMRWLRREMSKTEVAWVPPLFDELARSQMPAESAARVLIDRLADSLAMSTSELLDARW
ncbi:hypothetical protein G3I60_41110 [Streptomyces sp. SID13666]|uniref:hypothetical protein n=1 Tax=Streptomyces TaxID=1883 RepID=UPI0013BFC783|nr:MULTISPECIES: hypothetical protein [Streptomyces]NEA60396.1 hypothetical protein [Streptomyces sp. SID13666]NEA76828.1 hypothetical protein [Streptomyces sp. SID13588]